MVILVEKVGVEPQRPTIADRLLRAVGRPHRLLDEVPGEHMPCAPVAAIFEVLLVPPQSSRVDQEHRVDGRVHQAVPPASVAWATPWQKGRAMTVESISPGPV